MHQPQNTISFSNPLAFSENYPPPRVFATPREKGLHGSEPRPVPLNVAETLYADHARSSFFVIARALGDATVWLPTYHCPALVEPFMAAGKRIGLYPLTSELDADLGFLGANCAAGDSIVGIRYFGFDGNMAQLAEFAAARACLLIEDLAHAAFPGELIGQIGTTSLTKFYPVQAGSEIWISPEFAGAEKLIESHRRLPDARSRMARGLVDKIAARLPGMAPRGPEFRYFAPSMMYRGLERKSRQILLGSDHAHIRDARRRNFQYLADGLSSGSKGRPLYPELGESTIPYVFPFIMRSQDSFDVLRNRGIQIYRWEELADSSCAVSAEYHKNLIQLPVQQDLSQDDCDLIVSLLAA